MRAAGFDRIVLRLAAMAGLAALVACASTTTTGPSYSSYSGPMTDQLARCKAGSAGIYDAASFEDYVGRVRRAARGCGIRDATLDQAFAQTGRTIAGDEPAPRSLWAQRQYAAYPHGGVSERINPTRRYVEDRIDQLAENGYALLQQHETILRQVEQRYGVPAEYIVAVWGVETNYGNFTGSHDVIDTLANLGFSSSRRAFFTEELLGALIILDRGIVPRAQFRGSHAGAFGQPQFMPTSYINNAVDFDGDNRADLFGSYPDIFASIANYMRQRGRWDPAAGTAIFEVRLPHTFLFAEAHIDNRQDVDVWRGRRVTDVHGRALPAGIGDTAILLPAGCNGPAFMVTQNFYSVMDYNPLVEYAMAVTLVAETIRRGEYRVVKRWPNEAPLTQAQRIRLQETLNRGGFGDLNADGVMGRETRAAVRRAQAAARLCPDGYATATLLSRLTTPARRTTARR